MADSNNKDWIAYNHQRKESVVALWFSNSLLKVYESKDPDKVFKKISDEEMIKRLPSTVQKFIKLLGKHFINLLRHDHFAISMHVEGLSEEQFIEAAKTIGYDKYNPWPEHTGTVGVAISPSIPGVVTSLKLRYDKGGMITFSNPGLLEAKDPDKIFKPISPEDTVERAPAFVKKALALIGKKEADLYHDKYGTHCDSYKVRGIELTSEKFKKLFCSLFVRGYDLDIDRNFYGIEGFPITGEPFKTEIRYYHAPKELYIYWTK